MIMLLSLNGKYEKKSFNSQFQIYSDIAIMLYLRTYKLSRIKNRFDTNNIPANTFKRISKRHYKKVLTHLEKNNIITVNKHYCNLKLAKINNMEPFSRSYILHKDIRKEIESEIEKFKYKTVKVKLSERVICTVLSLKTLDYFDKVNNEITIDETEKVNFDKDHFSIQKNNSLPLKVPPCLEGIKIKGKAGSQNEFKEIKVNKSFSNTFKYIETLLEPDNRFQNIEKFYTKLQIDYKALWNYVKHDELDYIFWKQKLEDKIKIIPQLNKGRFYHIFQQMPKKMREAVLRFNGHKLVEVFDVPCADLHMMAKYLERIQHENGITDKELEEFQVEVKNDFRKKFGIDEKTGKCKKSVKTAFKIYFNLQSYDKYRYIRGTVKKIDEYFWKHFPHIREWIKNTFDIWKKGAEEEYQVVSVGMFNYLLRRKIFSLSCHDALYVLDTDVDKVKDRIKDIFYDELNLYIDRKAAMEKFYNL